MIMANGYSLSTDSDELLMPSIVLILMKMVDNWVLHAEIPSAHQKRRMVGIVLLD